MHLSTLHLYRNTTKCNQLATNCVESHIRKKCVPDELCSPVQPDSNWLQLFANLCQSDWEWLQSASCSVTLQKVFTQRLEMLHADPLCDQMGTAATFSQSPNAKVCVIRRQRLLLSNSSGDYFPILTLAWLNSRIQQEETPPIHHSELTYIRKHWEFRKIKLED